MVFNIDNYIVLSFIKDLIDIQQNHFVQNHYVKDYKDI